MKKLAIIALGVIGGLTSNMEAKTKPLTIVNTTGRDICVTWGHNKNKMGTFILALDSGKHITIENWNMDQETYIFVSPYPQGYYPNYLPAGIKLKGHLYQIPDGKTVNVEIKNINTIVPNAKFGNLKEKDIKIYCYHLDDETADKFYTQHEWREVTSEIAPKTVTITMTGKEYKSESARDLKALETLMEKYLEK